MLTCFECDAPAEHNHHVVPRSLGGQRTIPLCVSCHSKVHGRQLTSSALIKEGLDRARAMGKKLGGFRGFDNLGRDEFIKRTKEGQQRAMANGKMIGGRSGSPSKMKGKMMLTEAQREDIKALRGQGMTLVKISEIAGLSRPTVTKVLHENY